VKCGGTGGRNRFIKKSMSRLKGEKRQGGKRMDEKKTKMMQGQEEEQGGKQRKPPDWAISICRLGFKQRMRKIIKKDGNTRMVQTWKK